MGRVVAVAVPTVASVAIAIFIGWVLVVGGIAMGIHAISHRLPLSGLEAVLTVTAGLYVLIFPLSGTVTLTFVQAVWFFATGVNLTHARGATTRRPRRPGCRPWAASSQWSWAS
jgi:uncharacterized membrane protein HdeD (DUF308 family)